MENQPTTPSSLPALEGLEMLGFNQELAGTTNEIELLGHTSSDQKDAMKQAIQNFLEKISHANQCTDNTCPIKDCDIGKKLIDHVETTCQNKVSNGCNICTKFCAMVFDHSTNCSEARCSVPLCWKLKIMNQQQGQLFR